MASVLGGKPKKPLLFSFKARGRDWPSDSDDGDSDYQPDDGDYRPSKKKKKRHRSTNNGKKSKEKSKKRHRERTARRGQREVDSDADSEAANAAANAAVDGLDRWGQHILPELLLRIFKLVVASEGALPFLVRASRVNSLWSATAADARLWTSLDLSFGWVASRPTTLLWLCQHRLSLLRHLSLSAWKTAASTELQLLASYCPGLESLNLSYCGKIRAQEVRFLADSFDRLHGLDLSYTSTDAVSSQSLKYLLERRGAQFRSLNVSGNMLKGFNLVLGLISDKCPLLEALEASNTKTDTLSVHVERLQECCPRLRVLRLANTDLRAAAAAGPKAVLGSAGFPALEDLSLAVSPDRNCSGAAAINDDFIYRLLKHSERLRLLDLRGCQHVSCDTLQVLPAANLQRLYIARSSVAKHLNADKLQVIMHKWQRSLVEVDLSWNVLQSEALDQALQRLAADPASSQLQVINLAGTNVSERGLQSLLAGCPRLQRVNLISCRALQRGIKREYARDSLPQLSRAVDRWLEEQSD